MASSEPATPPAVLPLPTKAEVADTLGTLLGLTTTADEVPSADQTAAYSLSLHMSPDGTLIGAVAGDIEFAANAGVAIAGQSPKNAEDAIYKGSLGLDLWDNFREVSNVLNVLFTVDRRYRVLLHSIQRLDLPLWSRLQHTRSRSASYAVTMAGYQPAHVSVFSLADLEDQELVALLRAAGEEAAAHDTQVVGGKLIRPYDFHKPKGVERAQLNALRSNLVTFTKSAAAAMTELLQSAVHIKLVQLHHQGWDDYAGTLDSNAFISTFRFDPLPGHFVFTMSPGLSMKALDCRLAGSAMPGSIRRTLTDLDVALLGPIVKAVVTELGGTFSTFVPVRPQIVRHVTEKYMMEGATLSLNWLVAWMTVSVAGSTFDASLCFPIVPIQTVLVAMADAVQHGEHARSPEGTAPVTGVLPDIDVDLSAHFPAVQLTLDDIASVQIGTVIRLKADPTASLLLSSGGRPLATVDPVVVGRRLHVHVLEMIEDPEEFLSSAHLSSSRP